jgi:hypothetical protein
LPHSIIVTEEGVEGDVAAASQVEEATGPERSDLLGAMPASASTSEKSGRKLKSTSQLPQGAGSARKSHQMALFEKAAAKPTGKGTGSKPSAGHRKK